MECKKPAIRAARVSDFHAIGEDTGGYDACAYVIEHDGKVIGIGGLVYADLVHAFSKFLPECDKFKRFKVKLLYLVYGLAREPHAPRVSGDADFTMIKTPSDLARIIYRSGIR